MAVPIEKPLLDVITDQILKPESLPSDLKDLTPEGIEKAKALIEETTRETINQIPNYSIHDADLDDLSGFLINNSTQNRLVISQNLSTGMRIATIFHLLGHIKNGSAINDPHSKTTDDIRMTYEYKNRRVLNSELLNKEFAVDDLISRTVLRNPRIADNNAVSRALYQSYLPFTQARPR